MVLDGCSEDHIIERNKFYRCSSGGMHIGPGGMRTIQRVYVLNNIFLAVEGYGVKMHNADTTKNCLFKGNSFQDRAGGTAMTQAILCAGAGVHAIVDNFFACTNKISASSTDLCSGNRTSSAGNSPTYISET